MIAGFLGTARDITVRKLMADQLSLEKELFRTTLLSVGDGVIAADSNARVTIMNPAAEAIIGKNAKQSVGRQLQNRAGSPAWICLNRFWHPAVLRFMNIRYSGLLEVRMAHVIFRLNYAYPRSSIRKVRQPVW
jgi:hypothetical protein